MRKLINLVRLSLLVISFYLIGADCGFIVFSHFPASSPYHCSTSCGISEDTHHHGAEDHLVINDFNYESASSVDDFAVCSTGKITISDCYLCTIWQPPKLTQVISSLNG